MLISSDGGIEAAAVTTSSQSLSETTLSGDGSSGNIFEQQSTTTSSPKWSSAIENTVDRLSDTISSTIRQIYHTMTSNGSCPTNCSGRGECLNGACICPVQYDGSSCREPNYAYFASFAAVFYLIAAVSLAQLVICVRAEYRRQKTPSLRRAFGITTQKLLYVVIFAAAALRGAYFSSPDNAELTLAAGFMSAFYPVILTGGSLIVCFWAEAFHLTDVRCERPPRFLSKSFVGFFIFNAITYSLFLTEIFLTNSSDEEQRIFLSHVFSGCYAVLLFIVVVFFLIYGVEVYFKVRGGFLHDTLIVGAVRSRVAVPADQRAADSAAATPLRRPGAEIASAGTTTPAAASADGAHDSARVRLVHPEVGGSALRTVRQRGVDQSQLSQSRFGLVFQACMLLITVCFLFSDVLGGFWKNRASLVSRNAYDVVFRVVELGVALWFPCVLWNCMAPEQLWILNPRKILKKLDIDKSIELGSPVPKRDKDDDDGTAAECWICYEGEKAEAGTLIQPCECKGNMGAVHHHCLRKWLMECAENSPAQLSCRVCGAEYQLERGRAWIGRGFTTRHWMQTACLVTLICATVASAWTVIQMFDDAIIRSAAAGIALLIIYVCLRSLGFSTFNAYQRARYSAVKILGRHFAAPSTNGTATGTTLPDATMIPAPAVATISSQQMTAVDVTPGNPHVLPESRI